MKRGTVKQVGYCHPNGYMTGFCIEAGDYPGLEYKRGKFYRATGWSWVQMVLMARTGRALKP